MKNKIEMTFGPYSAGVHCGEEYFVVAKKHLRAEAERQYRNTTKESLKKQVEVLRAELKEKGNTALADRRELKMLVALIERELEKKG